MRFSLISINRKVLETPETESVTLPTKTGIVGILPMHEPLVAALAPGVMSVVVNGKETRFAIGGGVVETDGESVSVIADMVEEGGIDAEQARKRKEEAARLLREAREAGTVDMEAVIALEEEYMKEEARVKLASGTI